MPRPEAAVLPGRATRVGTGQAALQQRPWPDLFAVLAGALLLRLVFFNGAFGSDDAVYLERALQIARGDWSSSDYNGALRYGYNIPAGLMVALFGPSIAAANLWPLACSLAEIALAWAFVLAVWGRRAALFAALLLAAMPLHAAVATRIHADPVVSFFLTAAFVLFFFACRRGGRGLHVAAGLAMGAVFWTKELAAVTLFAFFAFPLAWRRIEPRWAWVVAGFGLMLGAHFAFMAVLAGDPLHLVRVVTGALGRTFIGAGQGEDAPLYYVRYLLLAVQHTGLAGWLAAATLVAWLLARRRAGAGAVRAGAGDAAVRAGAANAAVRAGAGYAAVRAGAADAAVPAGAGYAAVWLLALLAVLSVWPVSLSPLRFTMKQSNYLTLFLAPLAIVAGAGLASLPARAGQALLAAALAIGVLLTALEQADYRVFTANGRAAHAFAQANPGATLAGTASNAAVSAMLDRLADPALARNPVQRYDAIDRTPSTRPLYVIVDPATSAWFAGARRVDAPLPCWRRVQALAPSGLGAGPALAAAVIESTPAAVGAPLARFARPTIASVYAVDRADPLVRRNPMTSDRPAAASPWDTGSTDDFYDYYAQQSLSPATLERFRQTTEMVLRLFADDAAGPARSLDVLDVGCGAGTQGRHWLDRGHRYHGIDINAPLIGLAQRRAAAEGLAARFDIGSATALPHADRAMDVVVLPEILEHVADWRGVLDEAVRVLRPGGLLFATTSSRLCPRQDEFDLPLYSWYPAPLKRRYERLAVTTRPELVNHATYPAVNWFSYYQLRDHLAGRGFTSRDRFDIMDTAAKGRPVRWLVALLRALPPLRFLGHVLTPYTLVVARRSA